jgi:hypothetical protein
MKFEQHVEMSIVACVAGHEPPGSNKLRSKSVVVTTFDLVSRLGSKSRT